MRSVFTALAMGLFFIINPIAIAQDGGRDAATFAQKIWKDWSEKTPQFSQWAAVQVPVITGKLWSNADITVQKIKNVSSHHRFCSGSAPYAGEPVCKLTQPQLRERSTQFLERSPLTILVNMLISNAGSGNESAGQAQTLLVGLQQSLGVTGWHPNAAYIHEGIYKQFADCAPPVCRVGITKPAGLNTALKGMRLYAQAFGGETQQQAAKVFEQQGF